jgi:aldehyde dehydrogenase (NAD+)
MSQVQSIEARIAQRIGTIQKPFIGGQFVASVEGRTFETVNPATGESIAEVYACTAPDVDRAVQSARTAFESGPWRRLTASERGRLLFKLADLIEENREELAYLESLDNGKPIRETRGADIPLAIDHFRYYGGWSTKIVGQTIPVAGEYFNYTRHEPVGVVGQIIPWNFPLLMAAWKLAPALACGCTVILKPAEQTPLSALYLARLIQEAGFPEGVVNIVTGFGEDCGQAIVNHPGIDKIAFTGSTEVGRLIAAQAAGSLKRITLELGGKSPNIILPDADMSRAIPGALSGIMFNQGQVCCAGSRLYVQKKSYDNVVADLASRASSMIQGPGIDERSEIGPLVSLEQQNRVLSYIEAGRKEGAEVVCGGGNSSSAGYFVRPTIIAGANESMTIAREEIFGPVVCAIPFESIDDVINRANDNEFGLAAGVWTENIKNAHYVAERLRAGTVWVNCYNVFDAASPFGGYKNSGMGREMGDYALANYTEVKSVWINMQ